MVSFDLAFFNILTAISMEFDILTEDARNLKNLLKSEIFDQLQKIIDRQNRLFEIALRLEDSFTFSNLYYFLMASIIICLFAFIVSTSNDITQVILMGSMCVSTIYQLYLQCSYGQLLTDASGGFMDGIYDCGWEDFEDSKLRKMMILILMRTRKPASVTYMKFGHLTKQQFTNAIWRAYSYFTLCQQIYSKV
ncbi:odorant receptor Or2-like [Chironomus tepperi]|uniref:odorant receptor Or2-like n=1 Tax=Chironomus tepperi TaxID=113505 RepID=UPI00391F2369